MQLLLSYHTRKQGGAAKVKWKLINLFDWGLFKKFSSGGMCQPFRNFLKVHASMRKISNTICNLWNFSYDLGWLVWHKLNYTLPNREQLWDGPDLETTALTFVFLPLRPWLLFGQQKPRRQPRLLSPPRYVWFPCLSSVGRKFIIKGKWAAVHMARYAGTALFPWHPQGSVGKVWTGVKGVLTTHD